MPHELTPLQIHQFIHNGYIKLENAFSKEIAAQARAILWKDTGCDPSDPATWTQPVIRLGNYAHEPFVQAANTPLLHAAFNQLIGEGKWLPRTSLGTFPIRFPAKEEPGDTGWHVDAGFPGEQPDDYLSWRINIYSKGRALLLLFLFSDVGELDAPTRIRKGSHLEVARLLAPVGERGLSFMELAEKISKLTNNEEVLATGKAGTVYICHPFLAHAAQPHRGTQPRFLAQPPLIPATDFQIHRADDKYSPVEIAIRKAFGGD